MVQLEEKDALVVDDKSDLEAWVIEGVGPVIVGVEDEYVGLPLLPMVILGNGSGNPGRGGGPGGYIPGSIPNNANPPPRSGGGRKSNESSRLELL